MSLKGGTERLRVTTTRDFGLRTVKQCAANHNLFVPVISDLLKTKDLLRLALDGLDAVGRVLG